MGSSRDPTSRPTTGSATAGAPARVGVPRRRRRRLRGGDRAPDRREPGVTGVNRELYDEFMSTGAVIAGRGTYEPAGGWGGDHHDGVPIYILSRGPAPDWVAVWPNV